MRTLLHIGEVAQLLGVTTKTIRHYQKIGLLQEPERTAAGYRLFSAQELLRLQRIRRLQALGLSLKQIKVILGRPIQEHSLREVLEALDQELAEEIAQLQSRRERIRTLLAEAEITSVEQIPVESPGLALAQELLGENLARISPQVMEIEKQAWRLFDTFHWPNEYRASIEQVMRRFASEPELLTQLIALSEQLAALTALPEEAPEVQKLLEQCLANTELMSFLRGFSSSMEQVPALTEPFSNLFSELLGKSFSPAQWRFSSELSKHIMCTIDTKT